MKYNELKLKAKKATTRPGRGISAGRGKTAGRGTKGQNARTGHSRGNTSYGGRKNSLLKRLPHLPGFTSHRSPAQVIYTGQLDKFPETSVTNATLAKHGLIKNQYHTVKIIKKGDLTTAKEVSIQFASTAAVEMIQKSGGSFSKVEKPQRAKKAEKSS